MGDMKEGIIRHFENRWVDFYSRFVELPMQHNGSVKIRSPFRSDDKNPSFQINFDGEFAGRWHDYGTNEHGDLFNFYGKLNGTDFPGAVRGIGEEFGIVAPKKKPVAQDGPKLVKTLAERGISVQTAKAFQVEEGSGNSDVTHCIRFPIYDSDKNKVSTKTHHGPQTKGAKAQLYPWGALESDVIYMVNGEPSVWRTWEAGYRNALCGTGGEKVFAPEWVEKFRGKTVRLALDNDDTGRDGMAKIAEMLHVVAASIEIVQWPEGFLAKGDVEDWINAGNRLEDLEFAPYEPTVKDESKEDKTADDDESSKHPSQADRLVALALESCELFCDTLENPHALIYRDGHSEILRVGNRAFRRWLSRQMYDADKKAPASEAIATALNVIEAQAVFDGDKYELHNRVAPHDGAIWYDLTDADWRAVRITEDGWQITSDVPILFTRFGHQSPQAEPVAGGDVKRLFDFIAVADEDAQLLLLVFLVAALVPNIPHPIPVLHGPQGSGKSSCFRVLRRLVDPSVVEVLSFPRDNSELVQKLSHHWFIPFDNVTGLQGWQSDALCRAVTGEGFSKRQLYTDDEDIIYTFRRVIGLNGINIAATRADLLDRSVLIELERISPRLRRTDTDLREEFDSARPHILGGMFDALSKAIGHFPSVKLTTLPRMADFARWGCAISQGLGYTSDDFLRAYGANIEAQNEEVLLGHPIAAAVMALTRKQSAWEGTASELLSELVGIAEEEKIDTRAKLWPKAAHVLTRRLMEVKSNLVDAGISIAVNRSASVRTIAISKGSDNSVIAVTSVIDQKKQLVTNDATDDATAPTQNTVIGSVTNKVLKNKGDDGNDSNDATLPPEGVGCAELIGGRI